MPIVKSNTPIETTPKVYTPTVEPKEHKSVVVDTKYTPLSNLITHVEGAQWKVNYYAQVLNRDNAVTGHNPTKEAPYQQYTYIQEYILKVSSPLSTSQDEETKVMQVTGTATCYPPLVPNVGDMFVADIGDGRSGIFQVTLSEKKSIFKESVYEINYALVDYATGDRLHDLNKKVVKKVYFLMDFLEHGQNPFLSEEEWGLVRDLNKEYRYLAQDYVETFFSKKWKTFILPNQTASTYEHFITKAISHWLSSNIHPDLMYLKIYNTADDPYLSAFSIFDAIEERDLRSIRKCFTEVFVSSTREFHQNPRTQSLRYSGIQQVVLPLNASYKVKEEERRTRKHPRILVCQQGCCSSSGVIEESDNIRETTLLDGIPLTPTLSLNDSYILSPDFYNQETDNLSHLEIQLLNYFEREALNAKVILKIIFDMTNWTLLERFYFTPILLVLIKATVRELT